MIAGASGRPTDGCTHAEPTKQRFGTAWKSTLVYAGATMPANSAVMLAPIESPINKMRPTGAASNSAGNTGVTPNHGAGKSNAVRNAQPDIFTVPLVPVMVTSVVYPFQSPPRPSLAVVTAVSVPICGYRCWSCAALTLRVHVMSDELAARSPGSGWAVKMPPAVRPPLLDENSVRTTAPLARRITTPVVSAIAASVRGSSRL